MQPLPCSAPVPHLVQRRARQLPARRQPRHRADVRVDGVLPAQLADLHPPGGRAGKELRPQQARESACEGGEPPPAGPRPAALDAAERVFHSSRAGLQVLARAGGAHSDFADPGFVILTILSRANTRWRSSLARVSPVSARQVAIKRAWDGDPSAHGQWRAVGSGAADDEPRRPCASRAGGCACHESANTGGRRFAGRPALVGPPAQTCQGNAPRLRGCPRPAAHTRDSSLAAARAPRRRACARETRASQPFERANGAFRAPAGVRTAACSAKARAFSLLATRYTCMCRLAPVEVVGYEDHGPELLALGRVERHQLDLRGRASRNVEVRKAATFALRLQTL